MSHLVKYKYSKINKLMTGGLKFNNTVSIQVTQSDGKVIVGGNFVNHLGVFGRDRLVRLNSDGSVDALFCINASDNLKFGAIVSSIAVQSDGKVLVGGGFVNYAGTTGRNSLVRLNADGTLDTAFCANATDSTKFSSAVNAITVQSDGKIIVGGAFTVYAGTTGRSYLIRLNSDGTLDTAFCANATDGAKFSNVINSLTLQSDGKILVGGNFTSYAATTGRSRLVRLNSNGTLDTAFCANAVDGGKFGTVITIAALQSDGKILVAGNYVNYAGTFGRDRLIRLNSDGTLDTAFCVNASDSSKFGNTLNGVALQSDGKILVAGIYISYGGTSGRDRLVRLNSDGTLDTAFCANAVDSIKFSAAISWVSIQAGGRILVGGLFTTYLGLTNRSYFVALNSDGTLDALFSSLSSDPSHVMSATPNTIAIQPDGKIIIGGGFVNYAGTAGRNRLVRLNSDCTLDTAFCANAVDSVKFSAGVNKVLVQPDGKIIISGPFVNYAGTTGRNYLVRLNADGTLDTAFCANATDGAKFNNVVFSIAIQTDGKILVGGNFTNYGTVFRDRLVRLNSDGTTDTVFCGNAVDGQKFSNFIGTIISAIEIQTDGKILVGGSFQNYATTTGRNYLIRLNSNGTTDTAFCANATDGAKFSASIISCVIQTDNKILLGGSFINYAGTTGRNRMIRINSDGTTDTAFCANATDGSKFSSSISAIAIQSGGKIIISGLFVSYAGTSGRDRLIGLNSDGTTDTVFCANASDGSKFYSSYPSVITIQPDKKILLAGSFFDYGKSKYSNTKVSYLGRISQAGFLK